MKSKLLFITLALVLVCQNSLFAQDKPSEVPPVKVLKVALNLSEEQVTGIRDLLQIRAEAVKSTNDEIQLLQEQLEEILHSDAPDPLATGELVLETRDLRLEIGQYNEDFRLAFGALLTPEQTERVRNIKRIALANRAAEALSQLRLR